MDTSIAEPWLLLLFPLFFVAIWIGITVAIAVMAGWPRLAQRFPAQPLAARPLAAQPLAAQPLAAKGSPAGDVFAYASGAMRTRVFPVQYRNCLTVGVGDSGLRLGILFLFRVMHRPVLIPWAAIDSVARETKSFGRGAAVISIRDFDRRLVLYGKAGEKVAATFDRMKASESRDGGRRSHSLEMSAARPLG